MISVGRMKGSARIGGLNYPLDNDQRDKKEGTERPKGSARIGVLNYEKDGSSENDKHWAHEALGSEACATRERTASEIKKRAVNARGEAPALEA